MKALLIRIRILLRSRRNRQLLTRAVSVVAAIVVFVTTYALVLPAITLEQEAYCGILEHQHTDTCYEERLVCEIPEGEDHHHDASCYEKVLVCGQEVHIHSPECYQEDSIAVVSAGSETAAFTDFGTSAEVDEIFTEADQISAEPDGTFPEADQTFMDSDPFSGDGSDSDADTVAADSYAAADEADGGMEESAQETVPDDFGNSSDLPEDMDQENPAGADGFELTEDSSQNTADSDMEAIETGSSEDTDPGTVDADSMDAEDSEAPGIEAPENMGDEQVSGIETSENMEADTADQEEAESQNIEEDKDAASDEEGGSQGESVSDENENQFTESENSPDLNDWSDSAADTSDPAPEEDIFDEDGESNESNDFAADTADTGLEDEDTAVWETEDAGSADIAVEDADIAAGETEDAGSADIAAEDADIAAGETEDAGSSDIATEDANTAAGETEDAGSADTETTDADTAAGLEETANEAATDVPAEPAEAEKLFAGYVPQLDSIVFGSMLNKHTDFYYFHAEEGQEIPATSAEVTDWKKVKNGLFGSTKLETDDLVKAYFSYTIPAGALNETNQVARYRLPSNIHLTDDQITAINGTENGMTAIYADAAAIEDQKTADDADDQTHTEEAETDSITGSSPEDSGAASGTDEMDEENEADEADEAESAADSLDPAQDENAANYQKYLGAEAVEGTRTPDEKLKEGAQEYISAIVKVENVFDEEGLYGEKGAYLGQDLIFIFTPYSIEKNQITYDADGNPVSAGEKITGWFACDFNMSQIDWVEEDTDLDKSTVEKTAEVVFVEKDSEKNVKEISRTLKLVDKTGDQSDTAEGGETVAAAETAAVAETAAAAETTAAAETAGTAATAATAATSAETAATASETAATDEAAKDTEDTEASSFKSGTLTADGDGYKITLDYTKDAKIPENAELSVREITAETDREAYEACLEQAGQQVAADDKTSVDRKASRFFDIEILVKETDSEGKEATKKIEPSASVSVNIQIIDTPAAEDAASGDEKTERNDPAVLHFAEEGVEQIDSTVKTSQEQDGKDVRSGSEETEPATEISFEAESFSIYGVVYTVDFHWEVDGKEYEFSIPGGGFASFTDLVEVLGIAGDTSSAKNETDEAKKNATEDTAENAAEAEENNTKAAPLMLDDVVVSEESRKFVADVASVEFSSPELIWVGKVDSDSTVGGLKEDKGLECEYSAELTEEQIAEINVQTVEAGDWALISTHPFVTEETLTVTMTNGEEFVIKVTDAQISTHVITADGKDFIITVTYGENAQIPEGAVLKADEIIPETKEYEDYLKQAWAAICNENRQETEDVIRKDSADMPEESDEAEKEPADAATDNTSENEYISFARFFDIRIMAGGKKIEPAAPVKVTVTYADALDVAEGDGLYAVHFGKNGTEVINTSTNQDNKSVIFTQDSFSVTGTIVTNNGIWPTSGDSYVMYVQSGGNYYAIAHDGSLHQVSVSGNSLTFQDGADTFDLNNFLWTYEQQNAWGGRINSFVYYIDDSGSDYYLSPAGSSGIGENAVNLVRDSNGRIYVNNNYIGIGNDAIKGQTGQSSGASIQFASFPKNVTIHFVDRKGNPLSGVSYTGSDTYPVTPNEDGTFTVPYKWNMGNSEFTLQLDKNFKKTGYTYASSHLSGTRQGTTLKEDGLTIDAALKERNNRLYYYTDAGDNRQYGTLLEKNISSALSAPNENGTGLTSYSIPNVNKDIYVILDPVPPNPIEENPGGQADVKDPEFSKTLEPNDDGTYTLSLNAKGHGINSGKDPKANVIFIVDTSSSMDKTEGTGTGNSRLDDTKPELKKLAQDLLLSNTLTGNDDDTVEVMMVSFDGGVVKELGWTTDYTEFANQVDTGLVLHRGTDWEDALDRAYEEGIDKQAEEPDQQVFVIFFTDGEGSQYTSFHGQGSYEGTNVNPNYQRWYSYFLCRESAKDEARAIVRAGMQFYAIYAFNQDGLSYNGEKGSDLLCNLVRYAYDSETLGNKNFFAKASSTEDLKKAFKSILLSVREYLGFSDVVLNDDITSLTSTGINLVSSAVGGFTYTRSGGNYGSGTVWTDAPLATHTDSAGGNVTSVQWNLGSTVLEEGVTYAVSFKVWPSQEAYDWLANLENGTKTWADVVAAGLDAPNGNNPQIVKNGDSYSLLTNKPSLNSQEEIIYNKITYKKTHSESIAQSDIPPGTQMGEAIEGTDGDGNKTITTYTLENGVYTRTVVTEKKTYFKNPDPMPLVPERMNVLKDWQTSMNTSHPADQLKFRVLVDGKYYQNNGSLIEGDAGQANAKVLPVSGATSWKNSIEIAPGIVKYYDDDGNALSEALVLETGHKYELEEFDLMENGSAFLYYTSYEFHSQTMRPMIVDGTLEYLVLIDANNPAPVGAQTRTIGTETYYVAASGSGQGTMSGTNYRTAELDITKIIQNSTGLELTEAEMDAETFTYRVTLRIPDGTDPAGIVGYEYIPRTQSNAFTLFGYQTGETAFESDIERFSGKTFRSWNTLVYRDLVEWENVGGRIISKTDDYGNILWKVAKDAEGYHNITYDMTLNRKEVIRFTNLPTGTKYSIQEIYANYYQADYEDDSAGHAPIEKTSNIVKEGYEISGVLTTNGTVTKTETDNDTVSGTIDTPNVRYYNQFTNNLKSFKTKITILKTDQEGSRPLSGAVFDLYNEEGYGADPKSALKTGLISSDEEGKEGTIDLGSLSDGTYYLLETSAPAGYILLSNPVIITVNNGSVTYSQENSSLDDSGAGKTGDFHTGYQLKVVNDAGVELPSTGGPGTRFFMVLGSILIAGAGFLLWAGRRTI